LHPVNYKHKH
jgi:hypothetical protein